MESSDLPELFLSIESCLIVIFVWGQRLGSPMHHLDDVTLASVNADECTDQFLPQPRVIIDSISLKCKQPLTGQDLLCPMLRSVYF